jgi:GNAT superfamily N-acetyltransferase
VFAERGERFEWKLHGHDRPADLPDRLRAAGFVPEETETVMIGRVDDVAAEPSLPDGVVIREVRERGDFARIAQLEESVWRQEHSWVDHLAEERAADPEGLRVFLAEAGDLTVCAGWARFPSGTEFVTLWGGATLPGWRGRGIYRALVAHRARLAAERGRRYVEVDASDDSRPILERLGLVAVTTTTPYVWSPAGAA